MISGVVGSRQGERENDGSGISGRLDMTSSAAIEVMARIALDAAHYWGDRPWGWEESGEDVRATFRLTADDMLRALVSEGLVVLRDDLVQVGGTFVRDNGDRTVYGGPPLVSPVGGADEPVYRLADSPTPEGETT